MQTGDNMKSEVMNRISVVIFIVIFLFSGQQIDAAFRFADRAGKTVGEKHFQNKTKKSIQTAEDFPGFTEFKTFKGDVNSDKKADKIVIYEKKCGRNDKNAVENSKCRRIAVFLNVKNKYKLVGFNDNLVECSECGGGGVGDPFQNVKIKNGYFSVESLYGACDKTSIVTTFKYDKAAKNFYLSAIKTTDYSCKEETENGKINLKTKVESAENFGKIKFTDYDNAEQRH